MEKTGSKLETDPNGFNFLNLLFTILQFFVVQVNGIGNKKSPAIIFYTNSLQLLISDDFARIFVHFRAFSRVFCA